MAATGSQHFLSLLSRLDMWHTMLGFLLPMHLDFHPATVKVCLTKVSRWMVSMEAVSYWSPLYPQYPGGHLHLGCLSGNICGAGKVAQAVKGLLCKHEDLSWDSQDPQE